MELDVANFMGRGESGPALTTLQSIICRHIEYHESINRVDPSLIAPQILDLVFEAENFSQFLLEEIIDRDGLRFSQNLRIDACQ